MSKFIRLSALLLLLLLLAAPVLAQSGALFYHDDANRLDRSRVESAARPLINRGAKVALYTAQTGSDAEFQRRLERDGLARSDGALDRNTIAIYVSLDRFSGIRYGDNWNAALFTKNNIDTIYRNELNANLSPDNFTSGFVSALTAIDQAIANPPNPNVDTEINVDFVPLVVGGGALAALGIGGPLALRSYRRRRAVAQAFAKAQQAAEEGRRQAGAAIADLGQLMKDVQEKAQYDKVSYAAADVQQLAQTQGAAEAQFVKAQEQFDLAGEALAAKATPAQQDYQASADAYASVVQMVEAARQQLAQAEARRAELDKLNAAAPGKVDSAKKALADAAERLQALDQDFARPDAILQPAADLIARTESLLAEHRAADAIVAAEAASATIDELNGTLARYADIREGISAGRAGADKAAAQGYRVEAGLAAFNTSEGVLRQAAAALERDGPAQANALLDQAEAARVEGVARAGGMPALRHENEQRLEQTRQVGEQLDAHIAEGRKAFDLVDEFAENTWSDIRGNGSEAEGAAARVRSLWERAAQRNTMEQQDFLGAKQDLDAAQEQVAYAHTLIDTIIQRLKDLEAARDAARQEIAAAQADIDQGWAYVRSNDPDVGDVPEQTLAKAAALLEQANAELAKQRPDWLALVKQAQEANRLADEALAGARDEVEVMAKLRDQAQRAQQLATAEVQKIVQFASIHGNDIPAASEAKLNALQSDVQQAYAALQIAQQAEEQTRADALRDAIARYTALQSAADKLYDEIYAAFQRMEELRKRVAAEVERAERAIASAERTFAAYSSIIRRQSEGVRLLEHASATLETIGPLRSEDDMKRVLSAAAEARNLAERADKIFRDQVAAYQRANRSSDMGDFVTGAVIGALLSGAGDQRGSRGGWGGGGGGSSSSWGGGGGSSGSWGGGGGSSGSWGGGGGTSGGW